MRNFQFCWKQLHLTAKVANCLHRIFGEQDNIIPKHLRRQWSWLAMVQQNSHQQFQSLKSVKKFHQIVSRNFSVGTAEAIVLESCTVIQHYWPSTKSKSNDFQVVRNCGNDVSISVSKWRIFKVQLIHHHHHHHRHRVASGGAFYLWVK